VVVTLNTEVLLPTKGLYFAQNTPYGQEYEPSSLAWLQNRPLLNYPTRFIREPTSFSHTSITADSRHTTALQQERLRVYVTTVTNLAHSTRRSLVWKMDACTNQADSRMRSLSIANIKTLILRPSFCMIQLPRMVTGTCNVGGNQTRKRKYTKY
jgi:hypothetical protein